MKNALLYFFAKNSLTSKRWLHQLTRFIYLSVVFSALKLFLKQRAGTSFVNFISRNGIHSQSTFNAFLSDLDTTLVLKDETAENVFLTIRKAFSRIQSILIFIGEIEIYREKEFNCLQRRSKELQGFIEKVFILRKIFFIKSNAKSRAHPYHQLKTRRALEILYLKSQARLPESYFLRIDSRQLATKVPDWNDFYKNIRLYLRQFFKPELNALEKRKVSFVMIDSFHFSFQYLGVTIGNVSNSEFRPLFQEDYFYLAVLPVFEKQPALIKILDQIRDEVPRVKELHVTFLQEEWARALEYSRRELGSEEKKNTQIWIEMLEKQISRYV